jgi:WYL_2, Sm-like SH3 beta-barrel fold
MTTTKSTIWEQNETVRLLTGTPGTQYQESSETNQHIIRDWVRRLLQTTEVKVEFVKSDGTLRVMRCTLNPEQFPVVPTNVPAGPVDGIVLESKKPRKEPDVHSIRVYDLDIGEWRSFRFDRLQSVTVTLSFS